MHANKRVESAAYKSYNETIFMFYTLSSTVVLVKLKLTTLFFLMFRFHLNYRFIYYSSGIEFKSRSFWSGIVQHLVAWNSLYWFGCSYIPQLYTSICWVVIKLERLLVSIVVATILVNLTIHKDAFKIFRGSFVRYCFITLLQTWIV